MKNVFKKVGIGVGVLILLLVFVVAGYLIYVIADYERIEDNKELTIVKAESLARSSAVPVDKKLKITTYNVGFGAYSQDFSFFMDGGKYSRAISKQYVLDDTNGAIDVIQNEKPDFSLFQEVDEDSTRSYHVDQKKMIEEAFAGFDSVYAQNFHSAYLFYPVTCPHGKSNSGIQTLSSYEISSSIRRSFPVPMGFPDKYIDLDRCYSITRIPTANGKELVLYNTHLSAYTGDDSIRTNQVKMLLDDMQTDFDAGNYVICGGDFNHDMLGTSNELFDNPEGEYSWAGPFPEEMISKDFTIGLKTLSDAQVSRLAPTCRDTKEVYTGENPVWILDTFIVSSNIEVVSYRNVDSDFMFSDHNPVSMSFILKGDQEN